jgi:sialate O-acetylesterase
MKIRIPLFIITIISCFRVCASGQGNDKEIKIACIGNSVTAGYGLPQPSTQSYPALLQQKLGSQYEVRNFGHSGATLLRNGHNPYYLTKEFKQAINFRPDIAIIHLGLNDTDPRDWPNYRDDFIPDYNWLIDTLRSVNPAMKIYICSLTPIFTGHPRFMSSNFTWYWEVQQLISQIVKINHVGFIDLYAAFHNRPDLFTDKATLHPNIHGAEKLCEVIYSNITGDFGGLHLADIFTSNMVIQRNRPFPVWGTDDADTRVNVSFHGRVVTDISGSDGHWKVWFPPMKADNKRDTLQVRTIHQSVKLTNILIGDVWLCAGQSNMEFSLSQSIGGKKEAKGADPKQHLRLFDYRSYAQTNAEVWDSITLAKANNLDFFSGSWNINTQRAASEFSAVGYYFGMKIQKEEKIPVGLIEVAVGGSPLISWLDRLTLESDPLFEPALHNWRTSDYIMKWCRDRANLNLKNAQSPYQRHPYDPCFNFEAAIAHLIQFPVRGVIWYQGESDADNPELFSKLFPLFVKDWRKRWGYDFPFYYVQLSSLDRPSWNYFRNTQRLLLNQIPNSGMVVTSDLGDSTNVHYANKRPVGIRLANLALHNNYGKENIVPDGPMAIHAIENNNTIAISFLHNNGLTTSDGKPLRGFELVNEDGYQVAGNAHIEDRKVIVDIPGEEKITNVLYGWKPFTRANLMNGAKLPASTFMLKVTR